VPRWRPSPSFGLDDRHRRLAILLFFVDLFLLFSLSWSFFLEQPKRIPLLASVWETQGHVGPTIKKQGLSSLVSA
jgi:hypothetical protein